MTPITRKQSGAAILSAMLLVTLVAAMSAAAVWQQWRGIEIETAERHRMQSGWILQGVLDWARLILREDARSGLTDHLAEPWAVHLQEARLSSFLATGQGQTDTTETLQTAYLSGQITDLQARMNVMNLVQDGAVHTPTVQAFARLYSNLGLPESELQALVQTLKQAQGTNAQGQPPIDNSVAIPLLPRSVDQLTWLGLSPGSLQALRPYIIVLAERTTINVNTAPALVLHASIPGLSMADAQRLTNERAQSHFRTLADVGKSVPAVATALMEDQLGVATRFFEVQGQLRLDGAVVVERSIVQRDGLVVRVLGRERGAPPPTTYVQ
jgi:general secretion pathway protein K